MAQNESPESVNVGEHARVSEAERQERIKQLFLRRSKLSAEEAVLLREVFPQIVEEHHDQVWDHLRKWRLDTQDVEDLYQEVFLALHKHILEHGFPDSVSGMLYRITENKLSNHKRPLKRAPDLVELPTSSTEVPGSQLDIENVLHFKKLVRRLLPQLSPEHQAVLDMVVLKDLLDIEAAEALGIPRGTLKSRLNTAKRALFALAESLVPPSQMGPL